MARKTIHAKAQFLSAEGKDVDALFHYILVLYYDMSGMGNGGSYEAEIQYLSLTPAIIKAIYNNKIHFTAEMIDRCYDRYKLPRHHFTKTQFTKLLNLIFED